MLAAILGWLRAVNPLASLTGRIFIWFWLTLVVISVASFIVLQQWARPYQLTEISNEERALLVQQRAELSAYLAAGMTPLQAIRYANIRFGLNHYLVDPNFRLLGSPQPEQMELYIIGAMVESDTVQSGTWETVKWLGALPLTYRGETYRVLMKRTIEPVRSGISRMLDERVTWTLLALIVSGVLSLYLAYSLSRPLKLLRITSRSLASGRLESRVPASVSRRADDIGQLGHDFDDMAERIQSLIEAQQKLLSNISHELRSPLTRLQIALGIARQRATDDSSAPQLDRIEREAQRLETMIAQLLQLSRLENRLQHMDLQVIDLARVLQTIVDDARFEASSDDCEVSLSLNHHTRVIGDQMLLSSAIENVIRNAIKYSRATGTVGIATRQRDTSVELSVSDQGGGVPESDLPRLFDAFYRASNSSAGGSGLGLSITRQAIEAHHGSVEAMNNPDGGLTIRFDIPITQPGDDTTPADGRLPQRSDKDPLPRDEDD